MALTFIKLFQPQQLGTATSTIYTCPNTVATMVLKNGRVRLVNTSGAVATATLYAVPAGGSASASNEFLNSTAIAINGYLDVDIPSLAAGDALQAKSGTAASITIHELGGVLFS